MQASFQEQLQSPCVCVILWENSIFVTLGTTGVTRMDAKGNKRPGVNGEVYMTQLREQLILACHELMQGAPHEACWIF